MFCPNCGQRLQDEAKFCTICGTQIDRSKLYADSNSAQENTQSYNSQNYYGAQDASQSFYGNTYNNGYMNSNQAEARQEDIPHPETLSPVFAWCLAIIPMIVGTIAGYIAINSIDIASIIQNSANTYNYYIDYPVSYSVLSGIVSVLNVVFLCLDGWNLKKSGYSLGSFWWVGFLIMPVYLFLRAAKTDKKYGYAITWLVMYAIELVVVFYTAFKAVYPYVANLMSTF